MQLGAEVNHSVKCKILWLHQFVLRNSAPIKFDLLTIPELVSGLLSMADIAKHKKKSEAKSIKYLAKEVLEDAKVL